MKRLAAGVEDMVATLAFAGVILLPLAEIALRPLGEGIPGSAPFAQRLTMWVGLLGAAIAAREGKLLALATGTFLPAGRVKRGADLVAGLVGATVSMILAGGAATLVRSERLAGTRIALGVPEWVAELALPVAFGPGGGRRAGAAGRPRPEAW